MFGKVRFFLRKAEDEETAFDAGLYGLPSAAQNSNLNETSNSGEYQWQVAADLPTGMYVLRVSSVSDATNVDDSEIFIARAMGKPYRITVNSTLSSAVELMLHGAYGQVNASISNGETSISTYDLGEITALTALGATVGKNLGVVVYEGSRVTGTFGIQTNSPDVENCFELPCNSCVETSGSRLLWPSVTLVLFYQSAVYKSPSIHNSTVRHTCLHT